MQALHGATGLCVVLCAPTGQRAWQWWVISMGRRAGWARGLSAGEGAQRVRGLEGAASSLLGEGSHTYLCANDGRIAMQSARPHV